MDIKKADNLNEFDVTLQVVNGKTIPIVKVKTETVVHPDGRKDVIIHAPTLSLINKKLKLGNLGGN